MNIQNRQKAQNNKKNNWGEGKNKIKLRIYIHPFNQTRK